MKAETLKKSILQYAMQGKLVEQNPDDEPASELLKRIKIEKEQLIKDGKIKKEKPLPPITQDEIPYKLPQGWEWVRLRDIVYNHGQKTPDKEFCYIDIGSIDNKRQCLSVQENIIAPQSAPSRARKIKYGDIIYSTVRTYLHNMCIIDKIYTHEPIASTGFAVLTCYLGLFNKYLFYYLLSPEFDSYANSTENSKGVAYPAINDDRLYKALIPLPPLAEQQRIVEKLEQILQLVDEYGKNEEKLSQLNKTLPEKLKQSILQHAVQGKLVPQNPTDEPASELLKRIKAEKEQLIKDGKIKKEKPLPPITQDEIPFELPQGWKWVRFQEILDVRDGTHDSPKYQQTGYPFVTSKNLNNGTLDFSNIQYISKEDFLKFSARSYVENDDILFAMIGSIGNPVIVKKDREFSIKNVALFKKSNFISIKYLYYYLLYLQDILRNNATGAVQAFVSLSLLRLSLFPLPPLAEQQRIVAKVEEIMKIVSNLKT
jgi:type I restriction enzyme S subunit